MQSTAQTCKNRLFYAANRTKFEAVCVIGNNLAFITEKPSVFADNGKNANILCCQTTSLLPIAAIRRR